MELKQHVRVVAALRIGFSVLGLVGAGIVFVVLVGLGLILVDTEAVRMLLFVGTTVGAFLAILSVPGILAGIGLLRRWSWARWLTVILAAFDLVNIPFGTLFGVYALWVMLQEDTEQLFA
jgi:hypothetical protein